MNLEKKVGEEKMNLRTNRFHAFSRQMLEVEGAVT